MKWTVLVAAVVSAAWMIFVIWIGSLRLAHATNYLGLATVLWLPQAKGIAPRINYLVGNAWLVLTSTFQWAILGGIAHKIYKLSN